MSPDQFQLCMHYGFDILLLLVCISVSFVQARICYSRRIGIFLSACAILQLWYIHWLEAVVLDGCLFASGFC
jgi:hypothetical protein